MARSQTTWAQVRGAGRDRAKTPDRGGLPAKLAAGERLWPPDPPHRRSVGNDWRHTAILPSTPLPTPSEGSIMAGSVSRPGGDPSLGGQQIHKPTRVRGLG